MHGAGNSFALIENRNGELRGIDPGELAVLLCSGNAGFKADGMIVITRAEELADFGMLFYNADGSVGEMCGNGARCLARYGVEHGLAEDPDNIRIAAFRTLSGYFHRKQPPAVHFHVFCRPIYFPVTGCTIY